MSDSGEDSDYTQYPHCIICHQGPNADGPLIHACNCLGDHGLYHWPCLAGMIESMRDWPCTLCGRRFTDPRIQRYEYTPTFMQFLFRDMWTTPGFFMLVGGSEALVVAICSALILYTSDDFYHYLFVIFMVLVAIGIMIACANMAYNQHIQVGDYPFHFTRLLGLPDAPGGVMIIDATNTERQLEERREMAEQRAQEELEKQQLDVPEEKDEGQHLEELEAPEPMPAIQPGPPRLGPRAEPLAIPPYRRRGPTYEQIWGFHPLRMPGAHQQEGPSGRGQPLPQRRRHSFSGQESRRQSTHQRRHSQ